MPTTLLIQNKLLSLRGKILINNERGDPLYTARGQFALFCPTWKINKNGNELAAIQRRFWAWSRTWKVSGSLGEFTIKRKRFSWNRTYRTVGGPYNGATVKGNLFDLKFRIEHLNKTLASAKGKILSVRDVHSIVVSDTNATAEMFAALVMVVLMLDRRSESRNSGD